MRLNQQIKEYALVLTGKIRDHPRLPLPIGVSDFRLAQAEYYYVDKTMLIKDFIDERPMVTLFTRPRRFGKTLNMDMLRTFFEKTEQIHRYIFRIRKYGHAVRNTGRIRASTRLFS